MKKILSLFFIAGFLLVASNAAAQMGMMSSGNYTSQTTNNEINAILQNIYNSQNAGSQSNLDCAKISDEDFERLGDAYMETIHSGEIHEYMDQMMGGEGSESLRQAHINMGRAYLGCWSNYSSTPLMMPMMGSGMGMMGSGMMAAGGYGFGSNMMSGFGGGNMGGFFGSMYWTGWITIILVWILLILGIIALVKWLGKNK